MPVEVVADQIPGSIYVREDKVYFRSVYDREYDPFYQLTEDAAEDDRYLYSMNLGGSV